MDPTTAASTLATLVGLICNWKAERGAAATDRFQDFMTYLSEHQFEAIRADVSRSQELQIQLRGLLMLNLGQMTDQLNLVSQGIAALASKLDSLAPLTRALGASGDSLSEQAVEILKVLDQTGSEFMVESPGGGGFQFIPSQKAYAFTERRFINNDLDMLMRMGLIQLSHETASEFRIFEITRLGSRYASQLPTISLPD